MLDKTSIIVCAYDITPSPALRNITRACLGNIAKYTDRDTYELILADQVPSSDIHAGYHCADIDKHIILGDIGSSAAYNRAAERANPDYKYICFMHNDVFVWEGWLPTLLSYLDRFKEVLPHQGPTTRKQMKEFESQENPMGNNDAGLIVMTKETFKETGGWDERFGAVYQDLAFRRRLPPESWTTAKCVITHIGAVTIFADEARRIKKYNEEEKLLQQMYAEDRPK